MKMETLYLFDKIKKYIKNRINFVDDRLTDINNSIQDRFDEMKNRLQIVIDRLDNIERKEENIMSKFDTLEGFVQAVNVETNRIATLVQGLLDQISGGLSASEADKLIADNQAIVAGLQAIGASNTPTIPEPPVDQPPADTGSTPSGSDSGVV